MWVTGWGPRSQLWLHHEPGTCPEWGSERGGCLLPVYLCPSEMAGGGGGGCRDRLQGSGSREPLAGQSSLPTPPSPTPPPPPPPVVSRKGALTLQLLGHGEVLRVWNRYQTPGAQRQFRYLPGGMGSVHQVGTHLCDWPGDSSWHPLRFMTPLE